MDLIDEIWNRGYEVFLVGGTVRDVVAGGEAHDVDLVTSMPLKHAVPLLTRMFRSDPDIDEENGYVRLGGPWKDGAPFIDLKSFVFRQPGSAEAVFAGDIIRDHKHRDFACNALYYDPVNDALLDPSGIGLHGAENLELAVVCDPSARPPYHRATIAIRFVKFCARGFCYSEATKTEIQNIYMPALDAMRNSNIFAVLKRQVFSKTPVDQHVHTVEKIGEVFEQLGAGDVWETRILPLLSKGL
jgi:tRNA nucleotidyltransferase/poly(A) polymerase